MNCDPPTHTVPGVPLRSSRLLVSFPSGPCPEGSQATGRGKETREGEQDSPCCSHSFSLRTEKRCGETQAFFVKRHFSLWVQYQCLYFLVPLLSTSSVNPHFLLSSWSLPVVCGGRGHTSPPDPFTCSTTFTVCIYVSPVLFISFNDFKIYYRFDYGI